METGHKLIKLKTGLWVCWISLVILPLGVLLGAIGMCAGPTSTNGAIAMLAFGACGMIAALYGGYNVLRGIQFGSWPLRIFSVLSVGCAVLVILAGLLFTGEARDYLDSGLLGRH
jgi:hypothetical protein